MILTTEKAAQKLNSSIRTVQRLCKSKKIKSYKKLGKWYIFENDLIEFITN